MGSGNLHNQANEVDVWFKNELAGEEEEARKRKSIGDICLIVLHFLFSPFALADRIAGGYRRQALAMLRREMEFVCWAMNSAEITPILAKQAFENLKSIGEIPIVRAIPPSQPLTELRIAMPAAYRGAPSRSTLAIASNFLRLLNKKYQGRFLLGQGSHPNGGQAVSVFRVLSNSDLGRVTVVFRPLDGNEVAVEVFCNAYSATSPHNGSPWLSFRGLAVSGYAPYGLIVQGLAYLSIHTLFELAPIVEHSDARPWFWDGDKEGTMTRAYGDAYENPDLPRQPLVNDHGIASPFHESAFFKGPVLTPSHIKLMGSEFYERYRPEDFFEFFGKFRSREGVFFFIIKRGFFAQTLLVVAALIFFSGVADILGSIFRGQWFGVLGVFAILMGLAWLWKCRRENQRIVAKLEADLEKEISFVHFHVRDSKTSEVSYEIPEHRIFADQVVKVLEETSQAIQTP